MHPDYKIERFVTMKSRSVKLTLWNKEIVPTKPKPIALIRSWEGDTTMQNTKKLTVLSMVVLFSLILSLMFPISVLADDTTPPPAETPEVLPPTEEPVTTQEPVATEAPVIVEATPTMPFSTDVPVTDEAPPTAGEGDVDLTEIVQAAAESNLMLADPSGEPLGLGTMEAAETLTTGDPYFMSGGILYAFTFADCDPVTAGPQPCSNPIQAALTFSETHLPDLLVAP